MGLRPERRSDRLAASTASTSRGPRERLTWIGGASDRSEPHARDIALRWRAEEATVLATELRRAFIAHTPAGTARVEVFVQHQLPCFLQTQLLLNGRQSGDPAKLARALVTIANQPQPPRRFIAGADASATAEQKIADLKAQIEAHRELSTSLAFD